MNREANSGMRRFLRIGIDYPLASLVFLLLVSLLAASGISRITIDTGPDRLLPREGPERQAYLQVAREFGSDNRSFILLRDEQLWTPAKLQALEHLHHELRQLPFVERIDDLFTTRSVRSVDGRLQSQPLLVAAPSSAAEADRARLAAQEDPIAARNVISADGRVLAIGVSVRERDRSSSGLEINAALEGVLASARTHFPSLVQVGPSRIEAELRQSLVRDMGVLAPASALVLLIVVFGFFRSAFAAVTALVVAALSLLWTFGMAAHAGIPVNILFAMLPSLVAVLGVVVTLRLISGYHHGLNLDTDPNSQERRARAVEVMLRKLGTPTLLLVLTMAFGFACTAFSGIPLVRDFGLAATFAVLANALIAVLLIPLLYAAFGPRQARPPAFSAAGWFSGRMARFSGMLHLRPAQWVLALATVLFAVLVQQSVGLRISNDPLSFFRADRPLVRESLRMQEEVAGARVFYITLDARAEGGFRDPGNLQRLANIQAFIAKQQVFDRSLSLADIVSQTNQQAAGGRLEAYRIPPSRKLVSQYLLLQPLQYLEPYVSHDFRRANIVVRHNVRDSSTLNRHIRELRKAVVHYAGPGIATVVAGENLLIGAAADQLLQGQAAALAALLVFGFVAVSLMFTSIKGGFIVLMPSVLTILVILGSMAIAGVPLSAGTMMVAVVAIGIAVEGTIHLFSRYTELCRGATNYDAVVIETVKQESAPMIAVSLALAAGFGVLLFSEFAPLAQFGALAAGAMLFSVFANLLITPLMSRIRLVGLYEILAMSMPRETLEGSLLFHGMSAYQIRKTILLSELREYRHGERLIEQGTMGRSMYLVVEGQIEVMRHDGAVTMRRALLGPGEVFGEIGFVHEAYRTADVRALGAVSVLRFDHNRLQKDLALFPHIMAKLNFNISGILGKRLAEMVEAHHASPSPGHAPGDDG
jgi:predicted RND superfamily exporter protein